MKKNKIYILLGIILLSSCLKEEINENPNVPTDVPMQTLLPPAQFSMANAIGGRTFTYSSIFSQQIEGTNNQELNTERYNPDELFIDNLWADYYVGFMINLKLIIEKAENENSPHYEGVAKVLMANALGNLTSIWGDVPFTEAMLSSENLQPSYDSQEQIYQQIQTLLDEAIVALQQPESVFSPAGDDVIYSGNLNKWVKAAHSLKARYYLHTSKVNTMAYSNALFEVNAGIDNTMNNLAYNFLGTSIDGNPIYGYFEITPNAVVDPQFQSLIDELEDPREEYLIDLIPFTGGLTKPGPAVASIHSPISFISYVETKFIEAEAHLNEGLVTLAEEALQEAIESSMEEIGNFEIDASVVSDYISNHAQLGGTFEEDLEIIMTQKHIALFTQLETWSDYRRTNLPTLEPNDNGTTAANPNGEIPRRLLYPQSERIRNPNIPTPLPNMQDRFWWDQ